MFGKKGSNPDDDFDFNFGGDGELFPLGDFDIDEKPPKGIKGYLKNVAKSVKNVGIKLGKQYLPEATYLIDDLKEDDDTNPKTKLTMSQIKSKVSGYVKDAKEIVSDLGKDVKKSIKTGYFFKDDDDFGDIDLGLDFGDDDLGSISTFDDSDAPAADSSDSGESISTIRENNKLSSINIKTTKAQITANRRMHTDSINATIGATQAHMRVETGLFNQSMMLESEHHRQKMLVMKNIASNVGKIIKQNNVSLKAQMEYSLKSLAFSNDMTAMLKEIRNMQWKAYTPKETNNTSISTHRKIFGNGFNKKAWIQNFKTKSTSNFGGGIFDMFGMLKESLDSMGGLGMSKGSIIKSMVGDEIFNTISDAVLPAALKQNLNRMNGIIEGAPNAINNLLGSLSENGFKKGGIFDKLLGKVPFGDKIKQQIQNFAGYAHVDNLTKVQSGKFDLSDPNGVHPFDNAAHKSIVEVIPTYLRKIEAGINNHEEMVYNGHKFQTASSLKRELQRNRDSVMEYSEGYSQFSSNVTADLKNTKIEGLENLTSIQINQIVKNLLKTLYASGTQFVEKNLEAMKTPGTPINEKLSGAIDDELGLEVSEEQKIKIIGSLVRSIETMRDEGLNDPDKKVQFENLQKGMNTYQSRLTDVNLSMEEKLGNVGSASLYNEMTDNEHVDRELSKINTKLTTLSKQESALGTNNSGTSKGLKQKIRKQKLQLMQQAHELNLNKEGAVDYRINAPEELNATEMSQQTVSDWEIRALKDNSTNGIVNNIYKLLLDGLVVYPQKEMSSEVSGRYKARRSILSDIKRQKDEEFERRVEEEKENEESLKALSEEKLRNIQQYRYELNQKGPIAEALEKVPFLGRFLGGAAGIIDKSIGKLAGTVTDLAGHELYGSAIEKGGGADKVKTTINKSSESFVDEIDKIQNAAKEGGIVNGFKVAGKDIWNSTSGIRVKGKDTLNKSVNKAKNLASSIKDETSELVKATKEGGITGLGAKVLSDTKDFGKNTINSIKNLDQYQNLKKIFAEENAKLDTLMNDKAETNKFISKMFSAKKLTEEQVKEIYNTFETEGAKAGFELLGNNIKSNSSKLGNKLKNIPIVSKIISKFDRRKDETSELVKATKGDTDGDGIKEGTIIDQKKEKKDEEEREQKESQTKSLSTIASMLTSFFTNGLKLDKDTMKDLDESNKEMAESISESTSAAADTANGGFIDKLNGFIDKTGLGDTKVGKNIKSGLTKVGGALGTGKKIFKNTVGKTKLGKKILTKGSAVTGILGTSFKSIKTSFAKGGIKGVFKAGFKGTGKLVRTGVKSTIKGVGKATGGLLKGTAKGIGKAHTGILKRFLDIFGKSAEKIAKNPKIANGASKGIFGKAKDFIMKGVTKIAAKVAPKLTASITSMSSVVGPVVAFLGGFTVGLTSVKKTLMLGKDMKPTATMRIICAIASGLDALLFGIPTLIAQLVFKYKNFAQWLYEKVGSKAEKEALERYKRYCSMKSVIYGIADSNNLINYENRNVVNKVGRKALNILTLGLTKTNDEKDASILGFKSVEVYKYWKEKKYEPLENIRTEVAEKYGGLKVVEKTEKFTADKDKDGEIDENEKEEAEKQQQAIQNQQDYRVDFLKQARSYVKSNNLAWLTSETTIEQFKKRTGENANEMKSTGKKLKERAKFALTGGLLNPNNVKKLVKDPKFQKAKDKTIETAKKVGNKIKSGAKAVMSFGKKTADLTVKMFKKAGEKLKSTGKKVGNFIKDKVTKAKEKLSSMVSLTGQKVKSLINNLGNFVKKFLDNVAIKTIKGVKVLSSIFTKIIKAITNMCNKSVDFAKKMGTELLIFTMALPTTIIKAVKSFISGRKNPGKYIGIEVEQKTDKVKLIGGFIAMIKAILPSADEACTNTFNKGLKRVVFDEVMNENKNTNADDYLTQKAKILGLEVENMLNYENKLNENSATKKIGNFFKNIFSGGANRADARLCGFSSTKVFKFWREEKYEPLRTLEETIAHKFGDLDDLRSEIPSDKEIQKKFRQAYLREAKKYVKDRGLEWLTYKTTEEELAEREKNNTLYLKSDKQVKKDAKKASFGQKLKNFFFSSNRDTRGNAKQIYQNSNSKNISLFDINAADTKAMEEQLQKEYKYDDKAMRVMSQAASSIKTFWKSISPNFYGDQYEAKSVKDSKTDNSKDTVYEGNGGPVSNGSGLITKVRERTIKSGSAIVNKAIGNFDSTIGNVATISRNKFRDLKNSIDDGFGLNNPKINRAQVMNSIATDFTKNFGKELNKRLDILEEMHKENLRHNQVAENFYNAIITIAQAIAKNTVPKNISSSSLDSMISSLVK